MKGLGILACHHYTHTPEGEMLNLVRPVVSAVLILASAACSDGAGPTGAVAARQRWEAQHLSSYSYVADKTCFCWFPDGPGPMRVEVTQGTVSRVTVIATGVETTIAGWYTIDELFEQILYGSGTPPTVAFDPVRGYPTRVEVCCLANDSGSIYTAASVTPTT
ncbi:MAG TPA: DUF6174 domain-containing protein [Gemmatimonadaceae bacterium]|nr:DUF6174 domain-containing protein [Gemmatimonadaceae bacterium]